MLSVLIEWKGKELMKRKILEVPVEVPMITIR